jgi:hypothetical protein
MKIGLKKQGKKNSSKKVLAVHFEDTSGSDTVRYFFPAIKDFLFDTKRAMNGIKADGKIMKALLFVLSINLMLIIAVHIFSTYVFKDSTFFLAEFNDLLGKISPVFPLYKGWFLIAAPFIAAALFILKTLMYHLALIPQKPKKGFKTTLKIAAYAESSKIYMIFLCVYLIIARIPAAANDYFKGFATWAFIILWLLSLIGSIKIVINGCIKFHKITEQEATFVAFFPYLITIILPLLVFEILLR